MIKAGILDHKTKKVRPVEVTSLVVLRDTKKGADDGLEGIPMEPDKGNIQIMMGEESFEEFFDMVLHYRKAILQAEQIGKDLIKKVTTINIHDYVIHAAESTTCPECNTEVLLLCKNDTPFKPSYYWCPKCQRIAEIGVGEIRKGKIE